MALLSWDLNYIHFLHKNTFGLYRHLQTCTRDPRWTDWFPNRQCNPVGFSFPLQEGFGENCNLLRAICRHLCMYVQIISKMFRTINSLKYQRRQYVKLRKVKKFQKLFFLRVLEFLTYFSGLTIQLINIKRSETSQSIEILALVICQSFKMKINASQFDVNWTVSSQS